MRWAASPEGVGTLVNCREIEYSSITWCCIIVGLEGGATVNTVIPFIIRKQKHSVFMEKKQLLFKEALALPIFGGRCQAMSYIIKEFVSCTIQVEYLGKAGVWRSVGACEQALDWVCF